MPITTLRRFAILCVALLAFPLAAATRTWTGTNSGSWIDPGNWGGTAPSPGDDLVFPTGALNQTNTNDFPAGTAFNSIAITGGTYTLLGNLIQLGAGGLSVATGGGNTLVLQITLAANQTWTDNGTGAFTMAGTVNLNGFTLILSIGGNSTINGAIAGSGAITKNGSGTIAFTAGNSYSGITTINAGYLIVMDPNGLGIEDGTAANGTVVNSGGTLSLLNVVLGNEAITATGPGQSGNGALQNTSCGNATFTGPITITGTVGINACGPGGSMTFNGVISGTNVQIQLFGTSPYFFNAVNTFNGLLVAEPAATPNVVNVGVTNAFSDVDVEVETNQTLRLNNFNDLLRAVRGAGNIDLGTATLTTVGSFSGPFSGVISGTGNLTTRGLNLTGPNTATGTLTVTASVIVSGGFWPGPVHVTSTATGSAAFSNNAVVGPVTVDAGGVVTFTNATTGNLTMAAGAEMDITDASHVTVNGTVSVSGAILRLGQSPAYPNGTQFVLIANDGTDPIIGTFAGVPEGGTITSLNSPQAYRVSYAGGSGNDLVMTAVTTTTTALTSAPNPSVGGQPVTFTATVSPNGGSPTPTGTVTFFDGSTSLGSAPVNGSGVATLSTSALVPGSHSITATYNGDANFGGSTSAPVVQNVQSPVPVPTLDPRMLIMLAVMLAIGGALLLRR